MPSSTGFSEVVKTETRAWKGWIWPWICIQLCWHSYEEGSRWGTLSFRLAENSFTCGLHIKSFHLSLTGMHPLPMVLFILKEWSWTFSEKEKTCSSLFAQTKSASEQGTWLNWWLLFRSQYSFWTQHCKLCFNIGFATSHTACTSCSQLHVRQESHSPEAAAWLQGSFKNCLHGKDLF